MIFDTNKYGNCVNINIGSNILSDVYNTTILDIL